MLRAKYVLPPSLPCLLPGSHSNEPLFVRSEKGSSKVGYLRQIKWKTNYRYILTSLLKDFQNLFYFFFFNTVISDVLRFPCSALPEAWCASL